LKIITIDNFIEDSFCNYLIEYHKKNFDHLYSKNNPNVAFKHRDTKVICCEEQAYVLDNIYFKVLYAKLNYLIKSHFQNSIVNYSQIVEWPERSKQDEHIDFDYHTYTSILYLNDDYKGGQTIVGNKKITPKKGKIILFDGNNIKHRVLEVSSGIRYTNATWYITPNLIFKK
jgi:hypothetical protein